jgi:hypothetical protein
MPFVDVPMYMGAVVFVLALLGIYLNWKDRFVRYLTIVLVTALIVSFGRTFPMLYDLFYSYVPFFNKFRVPSMILTLIQIIIPILAGYTLINISTNEIKTKLKKLFKNIMIGVGVLFLLSLLFNNIISNWFISRVAEAGQNGERLKPLYEYMASMFTGDLIINLALIALTFAFIFLFLIKKISRDILVISIIVFALIDLFRINLRAADYINNAEIEDLFKMPTYITAIKSQKDRETYRILNLKEQGLGSVKQNSNFNVYFLEQDFYGYSGIKPRAYQDLMEVVGPGNLTLWRMLNVKYLAFDKPTQIDGFEQIYSDANTSVYRNLTALPRIYFVDSVATKSAMEILNSIKRDEFDPQKVAFLEDERLTVDKPGTEAYANLIKYEDNYILAEVKSTGNNFLFVGDTYYPFGWKAYLDGVEIQIYKINHGFRGLLIPTGTHKVEIKFAPESFFIGKYVSLITNFLLIGFLIFALVKWKNKIPES